MELQIRVSNFKEEVLDSSIPVLLDFWATWCMPCRMLGPIVEKIAEKYEGRLKVGKVNVDEESALAEQHGIASIPCLILYQSGTIIKKQIGLVQQEVIEDLIKEYV